MMCKTDSDNQVTKYFFFVSNLYAQEILVCLLNLFINVCFVEWNGKRIKVVVLYFQSDFNAFITQVLMWNILVMFKINTNVIYR